MTNPALLSRLSRVRGIMFDIDGCLVISDGPSGQGGSALPGAKEAIAQARATGRKVCVFTNGTAQKPSDIAALLRDLGFDVSDEEVLTPAVVAAEVMKERYGDKPVIVFGGDGMQHDFIKRGMNVVDLESAYAGTPTNAAAIVVGWDVNFGRAKLQVAAEAVLAGADLYCTSDSPTFASHERLNVGVSGFIVTGLSHVTGKPYRILGKPSEEAMSVVSRVLGVPNEEILVIGDDINLESAMARRSGAVAGLVLTGTSTLAVLAEAPAAIAPELVINSMTELVDMFTEADRAHSLTSH
ncbi:MAG: HAD hydrolase-like protein [Actinomycetales bacterium]|nr:HAD hydrolase-like protein [Actinomycetales bacterium]